LPDRVGDTKRNHDVCIVSVGPVVLELEVRRQQRERLPVQVIDDGGRKENSADPPAQV
jgi:hypothetical protein